MVKIAPSILSADFLKLGEEIKAGADYLTVHYEASVALHRTIQRIKESGIKAGVSLNPATPVWSLEHILPDADIALLMSVNPGFGGQDFIPQIIDKIKTLKNLLREKGFPTLIEVDGGVKLENAADIISAGADILVMGSAFFNSENYGTIIKQFREIVGNR